MRGAPDLKQPVKEDDTHELVLGVPLPDDERQRDGGGELVAAVGLRETRLSEGEEEEGEGPGYTRVMTTGPDWTLCLKARE